ncbi:uncharacterized protein LTHEOB_11278 [Lasiodiplodia theobromae]|uniref:Uncharacterized protein n=1 Tax=Lasiodiplodia theobromae TaxID=45133 RepID=A0A5N5DBN3_9PEZI|nr:uncharacterized protein LTHEOB_11278 [Lasiodiplodia theobromae]KAB2574524.1 hypothetical protein DBV05_g6825 [Lasiodiplodia theobromae]KAF4537958.1 hypothetical protein LTHEOB_11278 [Lasiodiplodia theobromae]
MIPDPNDIPIIFTNLIPDLPDPLELPLYLENLPDYINDLTDDEPWSETHTWYSFFTPAATSLIDQLASNIAPAFTGLPDAPLTFPNEERAAAAPSISGAAAENYHVCGHRAAVPCPTGYNCVRRPGASCGPELDCGGYCVDVLNGVTLLADAATSTQSDNTTPLEFSQITDFYPTNTLVTSRRGNVMLPPRQVAAPESVGTEEPASTATSVFPPIPCGEGYPPCDPGLQCVDIFVSGIGFAEKRSYCAAVTPGDVSPPSSPLASSPIASLDSDNAPSPTHYPWPDTAWPGPITTLYPMFGPGPVGLSNYHPSSSTEEASPAAASSPALAPVPNGGAHPNIVPYPIVPPPIGPGSSPVASSPPASTPTEPAPTTLQCGGPTNETCPSGFTCVRDLDATAESPTGGCGPACGELGVCIVPERCGGFAGIPCSEPGRTCVDDPDDGCDPLSGGADCMGICV